MSSASMMKQASRLAAPAQENHAPPRHPNPTPTSSNPRSDTSFKRSQARGNLTTQLKDRGSQLPVKWTRSMTDMNISKYKNRNREFGDRTLHSRRGHLPGTGYRREYKSYDAVHDLQEDSRYCGDTGLQGKGRHPVDLLPDSVEGSSVPREVIKHVTIAELHKILEASKGKKQHGDDMKIVIDSVPNAYPNIKLTFKDQDLYQDQQKGVKLPAVGPVIPNNNSQKNQHKKSPAVEAKKIGKLSDIPMSTKACLALLERSQVSSTELTKKWIQQSPLGPSKNEEYDQADDEPMRIRSYQTNNRFRSAASSDSHSVSTGSVGTKLSDVKPVSAASKRGLKQGMLQKSAENIVGQTTEEPDKKRKQARKVRFGTDQYLHGDPHTNDTFPS